MELTPGQLTLPFVPHFQAWACALDALDQVATALPEESRLYWLANRTQEELERIMVLADNLTAALLAP